MTEEKELLMWGRHIMMGYANRQDATRKDMTEEWADPQMQVPMRPIARQYPPAYPQNIPQQVQPNAPERRPQNIGV